MIKHILLIIGVLLSFSFLSPAIANSNNPHVILETTLGNITIELDKKDAPISTENFLNYVNSGFYNGLIFHRVIPGFVIQGGGFNSKMVQQQTNAPITNEAKNGLRNLRGTLSMARTSAPNSATSQFFINLQDNRNLDHSSQNDGYAVFGKVISGMDVVDNIARASTVSFGMHQDVPATPIVITSAKEVK